MQTDCGACISRPNKINLFVVYYLKKAKIGRGYRIVYEMSPTRRSGAAQVGEVVYHAVWVLRVCVTLFYSAVFSCHYVMLFMYVCCFV